MTDYRGAGGPVLFDTIESGGDAPDSRTDPALLEYRDRVLRDRERLALLIAIYTRSEQYHEKNMPGMDELKRAIGTRKDQYREESLSLDHSWSRSIAGEPPEEEAPSEAGPAGSLERATERIRALPWPVKLGLPIAALLIIIAAVLLSYNCAGHRPRLFARQRHGRAEPRHRRPLPRQSERDEHHGTGP